MSSPFIAQIIITPYNFAPRNWAMCNGQTLSIAQNTALFSLLGTTFGGNGTTTFALPDLRGRAPVHPGSGAGLSPRVLGQVFGSENHTLTVNELPAHNHGGGGASAGQACSTLPGTSDLPSGRFPAITARPLYADAPTGGIGAGGGGTTNAGGNQPHSNMQPYLALNYIIALFGTFPSRN